MTTSLPDWAETAAVFLANTLPRDTEHEGWNDLASTAYQIGCTALVRLGYAEDRSWGAFPLATPQVPKICPRWDDICIAVLWLAGQTGSLVYRAKDGTVAPTHFGNGFVVKQIGAAPPSPPPPNIAAAFGLGPARASPDVHQVLESMHLISNGSWTSQAVPILWRTNPRHWALDFKSDDRFQAAIDYAVQTVPTDVRLRIEDRLTITKDDVDALIAQHAAGRDKSRQQFGPNAKLGSLPTRDQARKLVENLRENELDWIFFETWRLDDGWLVPAQAKAALGIFHDKLAIAMRQAVVVRLS